MKLKLPEHVRESYAALTPKQRLYCELVVDNNRPFTSYLQAFGVQTVSAKTLLRLQENEHVQAYIKHITETVCSHITIHSHLSNLSQIALDKKKPANVRVNASRTYLQAVSNNPMIQVNTQHNQTITLNIPVQDVDEDELNRLAGDIEIELLSDFDDND